MKTTIALPDGYNGHTARFYTEPVQTDGELVRLRCAEPGKEYMLRWARKVEIARRWAAENGITVC